MYNLTWIYFEWGIFLKTFLFVLLSLVIIDLLIFVFLASKEIKCIKERDPAARNYFEILLLIWVCTRWCGTDTRIFSINFIFIL